MPKQQNIRRYIVWIAVLALTMTLGSCGGGGGGSTDRGDLTSDAYQSVGLTGPSGDTPLTAAQAAANAEIIAKAIAADPDADWVPDPAPIINGKAITTFTADELKSLNGSLDAESVVRAEGSARALQRSESTIRMLPAGQLPASVDWRNKDGINWMTAIKNQQSCGSCVAFASMGTLEAMVRISGNNPALNVDLSESDLFRCTGSSGYQRGACAQGWHGYYAATQLQNVGVVPEACLPYQPQDNVCTAKCSGAAVTKIKSFAEGTKSGQWNTEISTPAWIKNHLQNGPVQASIMVYQDFFQYKSGVYKHVTGTKQGGHAIVIAGYSDEGGYWIVRNSWGSGWGESGYVRIKYGQVEIEDDIIAYQMDTAAASVTASVSPSSGATTGTYTLTCAVSNGTASTILEGRCNTTDAWAAISSGATRTCTYSAAGTYTPGCRVNSTTSDDVDAPVTVTAPATAACGNNSMESGEQCDDGNTVTETCAYGQTSCTVCNSACQNAAGAASYCGDGTADTASGEQCDDGSTTAGDGCSASCQTEAPAAVCGNGSVESGEQCDDGNTATETCAYGQASCSVCNSSCQNATGAASLCGDAATDAANGEQCDDGNTVTETCAYGQTSCSVCNSSCQNAAGAASLCGDAATDAANGEQCDDGNTVTETCAYGQASCTVCSSACQNAAGAASLCGDAATDAANGEQCDDGNTVTENCTYGQTSCTVCNSSCLNAAGATSYCGDGTPDNGSGELCDDGNTAGGDGCSASCQNEAASCGSHANQANCDADTYCNWETTISQCVDDYGAICPTYGSEAACEALSGCFWNAVSCVPFDCAFYTDQPTCGGDIDCVWRTGTSVCEFKTCEETVNQAICEGNPSCAWDTGSSTCHTFGCSDSGNQASCEGMFGCEWSSGSSLCFDHVFTNCPLYTDQASCETYAACVWDTGYLDCADSCTGYSMQSYCEADANCVWDAGNTQCMAY